ncbi:hypothetical protein SDC9_206107 [bioreactor metagenome]|uniref:Uncharacterized protein n=1 Tax=bioreactor metagenome TaxID=1076179 RepID=A0A645J5J4_9ZZZZ
MVLAGKADAIDRVGQHPRGQRRQLVLLAAHDLIQITATGKQNDGHQNEDQPSEGERHAAVYIGDIGQIDAGVNCHDTACYLGSTILPDHDR